MTREEIIKGLYRGYNCTEKDECFESGCKGCIEVLFTEYEQQIRAEAIEFISDNLIYPLLDIYDRGLWEHISYIELAKEWVKVLDDNPYPKVKNYKEERKKRFKTMDSKEVKGAEMKNELI